MKDNFVSKLVEEAENNYLRCHETTEAPWIISQIVKDTVIKVCDEIQRDLSTSRWIHTKINDIKNQAKESNETEAN